MKTTLPPSPIRAPVSLDTHATAMALPKARCPRCGYDQHGVMAAWGDAWPLDGRCAECGLSFEWRDLLNPDHRPPRWCVEAPRAAREFPLQVFGTTLRVWLSPLLWRTLKMTHPRRWDRLSGWLVAWLLVLLLTSMLATGVMATGFWQQQKRWSGAAPSTGAWTVFIQATLLPLSSTSAGHFGPWLTPGAAASRGLAYMRPIESARMLIRRVSVPISMLLAVPVCCGLAFAALPISRTRAKVRAAHIVRATFYAMAFVLPMVIAILASHVDSFWVAGGSAVIDGVMVVITGAAWLTLTALAFLGIPALVVFWWSCASHYLRMTEPWAVAISVTVLGLLTPVAIAGAVWVVFDPRWWRW